MGPRPKLPHLKNRYSTIINRAGPPGRGVYGLMGLLGRDHNHYGFTVWMAGGGIKGSTVYGSTDEFGFAAEANPTSVHDLHATMLHLPGLDHEELTLVLSYYLDGWSG